MVNLIKINNKLYGYKCDKTNLVDKVMYSDNTKWLSKNAAVNEWGQEAVANATLEEL